MTKKLRVRHRQARSTSCYHQIVQNDINGTHYLADEDIPDVVGIETMSDYVSENFRKRVAEGEIINNPCEYKKSLATNVGGGSWTLSGPEVNSHLEGCGYVTEFFLRSSHNTTPAQIAITTPEVGDGEAFSKQRCLANVDSTPYEFGEDALEIRETLRFLRNPLKSILDLVKSVKKTASSKANLAQNANDLSKSVASVWATKRFAAEPLVRSVMDAHEALTTIIEKKPERRIARGFHRDTKADADVWYSNYPDLGLETGDEFDLTLDYTDDWSAGIIYTVSNPLHNTSWKLGLRTKDIPHTVWQVVPYSFMVDRCLDISSAIQGFLNLADPDVTILAGWVRNKRNVEKTVRFSHAPSPGIYKRSVSGDFHHIQEFTYKRDVWSPSFIDALPTANAKGLVDDTIKILDLLALIRLAS